MNIDRIKISLAIVAIAELAQPLFAQNEEDALRMSSIMPGGTARSAGLANAFGALGGDGSSISINPAGFGVYRTSELSFTPSFEVNDATANYYGAKAADTQARLYFSNMLLAINSPSRSDADWKSSTFGLVFDRQVTHHWRHLAIGERVPSSLLHHFYNEATSVQNPDLGNDFPFTSRLAWETYGLDNGPNDTLVPAIPFGDDTRQEHAIETRGVSNNTSIFYSGNYKDKLYMGISIGLTGHRFRRVSLHSETALDEPASDLTGLTYRQDLNTTGHGFDVKFGVIGRITERFRMGASFHSPQWLRLNDSFSTEMTTEFSTPDTSGNYDYEFASDVGLFSYRFQTPWRVVASAAYIAGPNGLFSVDYDYADMSHMRYRQSSLGDGYTFRFENDVIAEVFQPVHTVRVGTEWRTGAWYYRVGWGYSTDPYVTTDERHGGGFQHYAGGIGYRTDHIGVDLGLNYLQRNSRYFLYSRADVDPVVADLRNYRMMVTVSLRP